MLDKNSHAIWRLLVSWVLVIVMLMPLGGAQALQNGFEAEPFNEDPVIFDDPIYDDPDDPDDPYDPSDPYDPNDPYGDPDDPEDPYDDDPYLDNDDPILDCCPDDPHIDDDDDPYAENGSNNNGDDELYPDDDTYLDDDYPFGNPENNPYSDIVKPSFITFEFYEDPVIIENIEEIFAPFEFLLYGVSAFDENEEQVEVHILCHGGSLLDNGLFDIENLEPGSSFTVEYFAIHPLTDEVFTTYRTFFIILPIMPLNDTVLTAAGNHVIGRDQHGNAQIGRIDNRILTGTITVNDGGTLIMHGGAIQSPNATAPVRVTVNNGGRFYMVGGQIRQGANLGTYGVLVNTGGTFVMGRCVLDCPTCIEHPPTIETRPWIIGQNTEARPAVFVNGGTFEMHEGLISLTTNLHARGVRVDSGNFTMYGGEIRNLQDHPPTGANEDNNFVPTTQPANDSGNNWGIGVDLRGSGTFTMRDGRIHSTATAVNLPSGTPTFNMHGGTIFNNRTGSTNRSPGVNVLSGTFNMPIGSTAVIRDNFQTWAGNVDDGGAGVRLMNSSSTFNMHGGTITENTHLGGIGGGVHVRNGATFNMHNGTISRNTAGRNDLGSGGGGVAVINANFTMHDGLISQNRTRTSGGGVSVLGTSANFTMYSGTITDNEATNNRVGRGIGGAGYYSGGGGVWVYNASFTMNGGSITFNRTGGFFNSWRSSNLATARAPVPTLQSGLRTSAEWMDIIPDGSTGTGGQNQNGGGVLVLRPSGSFTMNGGIISSNVAGDYLRYWGGNWNSLPRGGTYPGGGGIATRNHATVTINYGTISHNRSPAGGGIYVDNWAQVSIGGTGTPEYPTVIIENNVAYGRIFTNLLGFDGRGGGGIATGDGLYDGGRYVAHPVAGHASAPPYDPPGNGGFHNGTAVSVLDGTVIRNNISGGDGGGIYWWASSAVLIDDERYLHGMRVTRGALVENNIAYAGASADFRPIHEDPSRLTTVNGRIDDGLNQRHNLAPRRRIATTWIRNGRVNPGGMWISQGAAATRRTASDGSHFAGPGHHAFNNHDIRTVGGVVWPRTYQPYAPTIMQDIQLGRVQLEVVAPDSGAPTQGSNTPFPHVDMGNLQVGVSFASPDSLPTTIEVGTQGQRDAFRDMQTWTDGTRTPGFPIAPAPQPMMISTANPERSLAREVFSALPGTFDRFEWFIWSDDYGYISANQDTDGAVQRPVDSAGTILNARTHHNTVVTLDISYDGLNPTHRVTKVEVFGACGCRVLDSAWLRVVTPIGIDVEEYGVPNGWAPGPYLLNHFCVTHNTGTGADFNDISKRAGGAMHPGLLGNPVGTSVTLPTSGDRFYFEGCQACLDEHGGIEADYLNPLANHTFQHTLNFLTAGEPYTFRPDPGFGAYGLIFRVTIEPIEEDVLRLGITGDSIDFGTHNILDILLSDRSVIQLGSTNVFYDEQGDPLEEPIINATVPEDVGFTIHDSRNVRDEWHVFVRSEGDGVFNNMLRLNNGSGGGGAFIGRTTAPIFNYHDARELSTCTTTNISDCNCPTRLTRVTWADLIRMNRDVLVCMDVRYTSVPPTELHRATLIWTVLPEVPIDGTSWTFDEYNSSGTYETIVEMTNCPQQEGRTIALISTIADTPRRRKGVGPAPLQEND